MVVLVPWKVRAPIWAVCFWMRARRSSAALGVAETARVEATIEALKSRNLAILIISQSLEHVFRVLDRICVLRRGQQIGVREKAQTGKNEINSMIAGLTK